MKFIILAIVTALISQLAIAIEIVIFDKKGEIPGHCHFVAENKKYALANYLACDTGNVIIEVYLSHACNSKQFDNAVNLKSEHRTEYVSNGVGFIAYDLLDRNDGTPFFVRVIKNELHCVIATSKSLEEVRRALSGLWVDQ
tara:strand:+ start:359 stop:781 length:423 start_codon:yes stop_codon:yes gene_type:complete